MSLAPNENRSLGGIRVIGSFTALPPVNQRDSEDDLLVFCLGLGPSPRGLYMKQADNRYILLRMDRRSIF